PAPPPEHAAWLAGVDLAREASRRRLALSASGLEGTEPDIALPTTTDDDVLQTTAGLAKGQRDVELPPWSKGRYGTAVGRAVHGVLQVVDLSSGAGLDDAVRAQCVSEGVLSYFDVVAALARSALASRPVRSAAARRHWRESYVGAERSDGVLVEGFVDLIYQDDDGSLVVIDYKTDAVPEAALVARTEFYAPQLRAYLDSLRLATGQTKVRGELLFLRPESATAVPVSSP
ncbi:MAG: PD-(D/E)XK nuclease family protein, partial [Nocardioidaceae bacterium]